MPRILYFLLLALLLSCKQENKSIKDNLFLNPPAEGFNVEQSDERAIEIADSVMFAMGGRRAWDETRFISWNFFGRRNLLWDKHEGKVRIEIPSDSTIYLVNVYDGTGRVSIKGRELKDADSLLNYLRRAQQIWVNDSYWLVMPFKLKDSGVTLKYIGEEQVADTLSCKVLELTFAEVGFTPNNKYRVYIDKRDNLIKQWAYYQDANQEEASAVWPWDNYHQHGKILLSHDRSDGRGPKAVRVDDEIADKRLDEF